MIMNLTNILVLLMISCTWSKESSSQFHLRKIKISLDTPQDQMDRSLKTLQCSSGAGPDNHFTVRIDITPRGGSNSGICSSELQKSIGALINVVLDDFGFGKAGRGDNAVFSAEVCEAPNIDGRRLQTRFTWSGSGVCRSCGVDNGDGRLLESGDDDGDDDDEIWFTETYVPELTKKLTKGIAKSLPSTSHSCLGSSPDVNVIIQQVNVKPEVICESS
jgi:hypothetical protein